MIFMECTVNYIKHSKINPCKKKEKRYRQNGVRLIREFKGETGGKMAIGEWKTVVDPNPRYSGEKFGKILKIGVHLT